MAMDDEPEVFGPPDKTAIATLSGLYNQQCSELLGIAEWTWSKVECVEPDSFLYTGAVYPHRYRSGPRKGRINYSKPAPGTQRTLVVSRRDAVAWIEAWAHNQGVCGDCLGSGNSRFKADVSSGRTYKPCKRCGGSGKPVTP